MSKKVAVVTGLVGQDGSFLAEQLLEKDYKVYGMIRRSSRGLDLGCSAHLQGTPNLEIVEGDLIDGAGLNHLCDLAKPDVFFNMAAQSHVGTSFKQPYYTAQVDALGVLNCLEAIRLSGIHTRFLQASTSELYGGFLTEGANETSRFHPRSPYGVAKLYGYWIVVNYREAYKMFACNSICFNHECFFSDTPVFIEKNGDIDLVYVSSLVPSRTDINKDNSTCTRDYDNEGVNIWDGAKFVKLRAVSRRKLHSLRNTEDQKRQVTIAPNVSISTTPNHLLIKDMARGLKIQARDVTEGKELILGEYPGIRDSKMVTVSYAKFLGLLAGDGHVNETGVRLVNNDPNIQQLFIELAKDIYPNVSYAISTYPSGFDGTTTNVNLRGLHQGDFLVLRDALYEQKTKHKKVPAIILNAGPEIQRAFLDGYYLADGLKKDNTAYDFKSFKTNSALLAQGLLYLISHTLGVNYCINTFEQNNKLYHQVNLRSPENKHGFGKHLVKEYNVVKKHILRSEDNQHVFDIETETGVVMAGIGLAIVGNSERRGPNFVTRKITKAVVQIKAGKQDKLYLGNLDAKRDWGYAPDFCINTDVPILTPSGWRFCDELNVGDEVINFNLDQDGLDRDTIKAKCILPSNGDKILLTGVGGHLNVSPNHRIIYQQKSVNSKGGWSNWKECKAKEFAEKLNGYKNIRNKYDFRLPHFQNYSVQDLDIDDQTLYLVGILLAEGCFCPRKDLGWGSCLSISQSFVKNKQVYDKIENILTHLELDFTKRERNDGVCEWAFSSQSAKKILKMFDGYDVHQVPSWCFSLSQRQARIVFSAFMDGDGCWGDSSFSQKRFKLATDMQTIAHLAGYRCSAPKKRTDPADFVSYSTQVISCNNPYLHITDAKIYNDGANEVWCIETSNGTIVTRDGGCINISGNCRGMIMMLEDSSQAKDYVLSTGETHSVREFCDAAFGRVGLDYREYVEVDPQFYRPAEVDVLIGDSSLIKKDLGWKPSVSFTELVERMVDHDLQQEGIEL